MKKPWSFNVALLLVCVLFVQDSRAQDYTRWGLPEGALARLGKGHIGQIAYSPDGTRLAVDSRIGIWLYDAHTGTEVALLVETDPVITVTEVGLRVDDYTEYVNSLSFSPDGSTLASVSQGEIRLWDVISGQLKATLGEHTGGNGSVLFSPDGSTLASVSQGEIRLWDVISGQLKATLEDIWEVGSLSFSPDGSTLVSTGERGIRLWDVVSGQLKATLGEHTGVSSVSFSPDGSTLASASRGIQLWDVVSGQLKATLERRKGWVYSMSFSPDGSTLASSNWPEIRLWDVVSGQLKATLEGHMNQVYFVSFSPDGHTLVSSSSDGTILLWDMSPYITPSVPTEIQSSPPLPAQTALLANFPNPFNPETWIPYQLRAPAPVRLSIYDVRGTLVREIDLGYRVAGQYLTSASAAHWDGRDHHGERVASGVYLYRLQAGPVAQVRKMVLVK